MEILKRLEILALGVGMVVAVGASPAAAQTKEARGEVTAVSDSSLTVQAGERRPTLKNVLGKVKSIAGATLTVEVDGHHMAFTVDRDTDILARGASAATRKGGVPITDLVHEGDLVRVGYRDVNGSMKASEIQIRGRNTIAAR